MKFSEWMEEEDVEKWLDSLSEEELQEAINYRYDYVNNTKGLIGIWSFTTKKNNSYDVTIIKLSKDVHRVSFAYIDKNGNSITSLTNLKDNPTAIIGSVYGIVEKESIKKYSPKEIRFEAQGEKRQKIYDIVLRRYISKWMKKYGYELQTEQHEDLPLRIYRYVKEVTQ
jgi:predicted nucleic-acid-binding Zn-ribbon protein